MLSEVKGMVRELCQKVLIGAPLFKSNRPIKSSFIFNCPIRSSVTFAPVFTFFLSGARVNLRGDDIY